MPTILQRTRYRNKSTEYFNTLIPYLLKLNKELCEVACMFWYRQWRAEGGGGQGGHGPWAQALEGAPAQLVGPNCKKKIRPRPVPDYLVAKVAYASGPALSRAPRSLCLSFLLRGGVSFHFFLFFLLVDFFPSAPGGGGGRRCLIGPRAAGDPRYATGYRPSSMPIILMVLHWLDLYSVYNIPVVCL